jgi:hypothetical protein
VTCAAHEAHLVITLMRRASCCDTLKGVTAEHSLHMAFIIQMSKQVGGGVGGFGLGVLVRNSAGTYG